MTPKKWKEDPYIRNEMVEDIRNSKLFDRLSAYEVKNILEKTDDSQSYNDSKTTTFTYYCSSGYITVCFKNDKYEGIYYVPNTGIGLY